MKLILVRIGETEDTVNRVIQGDNDDKLTQKGKDEAKKIGSELREKYKIDLIFCSPFSSCVEALENILETYSFDGPIFMSKLIEERDFGEYVGAESILVDWETIDKDNKINKEMKVESLLEFTKRINLFLEDIKLEDENSTVLIISHDRPVKEIISKITGKQIDEINTINNSTFIFENFK